MFFVLGFIAGLMVATLIVATLTYFRRVIEHRVQIIEKTIESKGPKPQGFVIFPEDETEEVRSGIIDKNRKQGRDTPISELI